MKTEDVLGKLDWEKELDEVGRTAFADFQCGGDGLKKKESAEVLKTVYTMHLAQERNKDEIAIKKREANIKLCESIIDGTSKLALAGIGVGGTIYGAKKISEMIALDESPKVISNRAFNWTLNQVLKAAMSAALNAVRF